MASERYSDVTGYIILNEGYVFENGYVEKYDGENILLLHFTAQGQIIRNDCAGLMREPDRTCLANNADFYRGSLNLPWGRSTLGNEPMLLDVSWVDLPCVSSN